MIMAVHESHRLGRRVYFPMENRENPYEVWRGSRMIFTAERRGERGVGFWIPAFAGMTSWGAGMTGSVDSGYGKRGV